MKKFMKAIAFVTVMCLALSTVAFAENSVPKQADEDKTFVVNVTEAGANEQVALMVVAKGADFSNPLYINQQAADANGDTTFEAVLSNAVAEEVDVYVGYAANDTGSAIPVGTVKLEQPITEVTIAKGATSFVSAEGLQQMGAGATLTVNVVAPEGVYATNMIWAIRYEYEEAGETKSAVKYTDSFELSEQYGLGTLLTGDVKLGLAFLNGYNRVGEEIDAVEITGVDAIFKFSNNEVEFTNVDDADNEVPKAN